MPNLCILLPIIGGSEKSNISGFKQNQVGFISQIAHVAELADALDSGSSE
jgi:hypothetical protein